mgnify:CR=1 FL=1
MKIRAIAALLFILISVSAFGEGRIKITGYVRDADGNPLELVNVRVKNTLIGSMTNEKGYYSFSISPGDSISVIYSCLGYNKAETYHSFGTSRYAPERTDEQYLI